MPSRTIAAGDCVWPPSGRPVERAAMPDRQRAARDARARLRSRRPVSRTFGDVVRGSGLPSPVAGRSLRASRPSLAACPLRFGILPALAPTARLSGRGQPLPGPPVFALQGERPREPRVRQRKRTGIASCPCPSKSEAPARESIQAMQAMRKRTGIIPARPGKGQASFPLGLRRDAGGLVNRRRKGHTSCKISRSLVFPPDFLGVSGLTPGHGAFL
jgi:hypothetical protein